MTWLRMLVISQNGDQEKGITIRFFEQLYSKHFHMLAHEFTRAVTCDVIVPIMKWSKSN